MNSNSIPESHSLVEKQANFGFDTPHKKVPKNQLWLWPPTCLWRRRSFLCLVRGQTRVSLSKEQERNGKGESFAIHKRAFSPPLSIPSSHVWPLTIAQVYSFYILSLACLVHGGRIKRRRKGRSLLSSLFRNISLFPLLPFSSALSNGTRITIILYGVNWNDT